jgi:ABC-2 type transport system ATP-binding protein
VLVLDEPTTGLDPEARTALWQEIARLSAGDGVTILLTTHYLDEADRLADRLALVDKGRVVVSGTPWALKQQLRGDAVHVELQAVPGSDDEPLLRRAIGVIPGVGEITLDGRRLSARVDDGAAAVPAVLGALEGVGVAVAAVTVARPSLDDVYLRHVGRRFAEREAEAALVAGGAR